MDEKAIVDSASPAAGAASPDPARREGKEKDHFLRLMFFRASEGAEAAGSRPEGVAENYAPMQYMRTRPADRYALPLSNVAAAVRLDSPATEVMTDLRRVSAVTVERYRSVGEANQLMIDRGVRALFVVDDAPRVLGILTSMDVLSEKPVQFARARGLRHDEVVVGDIMTPAEHLEVVDYRDVLRAHVGDVVATLRVSGRQHALAVQVADGATAGQLLVCGIFSLTQIARQLGLPPQPVHDIARTFAEIEAVIAA